MRRLVSVGLVLLLSAGCAARAAPSGAPSVTYGTPAAEPAREVSVAGTVLSAVATPFYLVFKTVVCATTALIAVPGAAVLALTDRAFEERKREELDEGVARNCGPPYVLR
jgi:hypothetical protein